MQHQYLVTEDIPALVERGTDRLPLLRDPDVSYYLRQERQGFILGPYEWQCRAEWQDGIPADFAYQLWPDDLGRLERYIEDACARVPILAEGGVKRVVNGPIPYAPDGNPYIGPAHGLTNFYQCCCFSFGIAQSGGAGKFLSEWVVDGDAGMGRLGVRPAPLHRLRHHRLHGRQGDRAVPERVRRRLPVRGAPGRATGADYAALSRSWPPRAPASPPAMAGSGPPSSIPPARSRSRR